MSEAVPSEQLALGSSPVVTSVFDSILSDVHEGKLLPGQRLNDGELAKQLGVSRTPVREALQRLREIGIVEASASRFTRIADVTPRQTAEAVIVWLSLYRAVVSETIPRATLDVAKAMRADHAVFARQVAAGDFQAVATANLSFFSYLVAASTNSTLQRAITSVVHIVRLGSLHLPDQIDLDALTTSQVKLIEAAETKDLALALDALAIIERIEVPQPGNI